MRAGAAAARVDLAEQQALSVKHRGQAQKPTGVAARGCPCVWTFGHGPFSYRIGYELKCIIY
jgi:hypothetical protein